MPRQRIKDRAFQEPIHEDAPGFNPNQGHKNLITELNDEILPSWQTDLIGPEGASSGEYQFRRTASGTLEYFVGGSWQELQAAGAGGGTGGGNFNPTYAATCVVDAPFSSDCFVTVDITTDKSAQGSDFRVFQYGLERVCSVFTVGGTLDGRVQYRVSFEASLMPGQNEIQILYGDPLIGRRTNTEWTVLGDYDMVHGVWSFTDAYAILRPKVTPAYLPQLRNWAQAAAFGENIVLTDGNPQSSYWNFPQQYWNANTKTWVTPRLSGFQLDVSARITSYNWENSQRYGIGYRTSSYGTWGALAFVNIRSKTTPVGTLYGIRMSWENYRNTEEDAFYVYGLMNNGHWVFAEYKHMNRSWGHDARQTPLVYGLENGSFLYWSHPTATRRLTWADVSTVHQGNPEAYVFVPVLTGTLSAQDVPL